MPTGNRWRVYVNAYHVEQQYGGPEEGGWWYEAGYPKASMPVQLDTPIEYEYSDGSHEEFYEDAHEDRHVGWYDLSVNDAHTIALIVIELEKALSEYDDKDHPLWSVLSEGKLYIKLELAQASGWPHERPHYE